MNRCIQTLIMTVLLNCAFAVNSTLHALEKLPYTNNEYAAFNNAHDAKQTSLFTTKNCRKFLSVVFATAGTMAYCWLVWKIIQNIDSYELKTKFAVKIPNYWHLPLYYESVELRPRIGFKIVLEPF